MLKRKKVVGLKRVGPKGSGTPHVDVVGLGHTCYMIRVI